jgi:hypothetical protein
MGKLSYKRYKRNDVFVHLATEKEVELFQAWLKNNEYPYRLYTMPVGSFQCMKGSGTNVKFMTAGDKSIASVYALEGMMDKPRPTFKVGELVQVIDVEGCIDIDNAIGVVDRIRINNEYDIKDTLTGYTLRFKGKSLKRVQTVQCGSLRRGSN